MQFVVAVGVPGDLEQRLEDVAQELLEVGHYLVGLEDIAEIDNVIVKETVEGRSNHVEFSNELKQFGFILKFQWLFLYNGWIDKWIA